MKREPHSQDVADRANWALAIGFRSENHTHKMALDSEFERRSPTQAEMPAMCDHATDGSEKGDTTIDDGIAQDRRFTKQKRR
uniref:Uncharacterized protein n=1 Tax=Trichogramma kaykai TaxID=54128 RepID=A0ABD2WS29_9HYME